MHRFLFAMACCVALAGCATESGAPLPPSPSRAPAPQTGYIGASAAALRTDFGAPAFTRKDGSDELWRYDAAQCKAFFFLYPEDGHLRVRHVETMPRGNNRPADPSCLGALRARASQPVS